MSKLLVYREGRHLREAASQRIGEALPAREFDARIQQHESDPCTAGFLQAYRRTHRNFLPRAPRSGRLRAGFRRQRILPLELHCREPEKMERRRTAHRFRGGGPGAAPDGTESRPDRQGTNHRIFVERRPKFRPVARSSSDASRSRLTSAAKAKSSTTAVTRPSIRNSRVRSQHRPQGSTSRRRSSRNCEIPGT